MAGWGSYRGEAIESTLRTKFRHFNDRGLSNLVVCEGRSDLTRSADEFLPIQAKLKSLRVFARGKHIWCTRHSTRYLRARSLLSVVGVLAVFTEEVFIQQTSANGGLTGTEGLRPQCHSGDFFEDDGVDD